ncbi:MAG TPA: N-acetylmuramoyl-L-alanine amidase [Gaiellaceae bacterium]
MVVLCALALTGAAAASPPQNELAAQTNYTRAERPASEIRFIVIHVSEGSFLGTVSWLRDPRAHASANFVVSRTGHVQELVPLHDIAWHAGNWAYNLRSIGIENEGYTDSPAGFTLPEYRASARVAAVIARRSLIPIDRRHIIGHYQVPDPNDPLQGGGIDNHTDPGKYWDWTLFMRLVQRFAYPQRFLRHKHVGLEIESSTLTDRQVIAGEVPWRTTVGGPVKHVSFLVDGKLRWTDRVGPYAYAGGKRLFDTLSLSNGKHVLEVRAYGAKSWTRQRFTVRVRNEPFTLAPVNLKAKQQVSGVVPVQAVFTGAAPARVLLYVDGKQIDHDTSAPYIFKWDTRRTTDGLHVVTLAGRARDGRIVRTRVHVNVLNGLTPPTVLADSLVDGQIVSGVQHWLVETGGSVARVEFVVDGTLRSTVAAAPYAYDWDTGSEAVGSHQLIVRGVGLDGIVSEQTVTVTVAAPTGP